MTGMLTPYDGAGRGVVVVLLKFWNFLQTGRWSPRGIGGQDRSQKSEGGRRNSICCHGMAEEDLKAELERLRAENEALKRPGRGQISIRVSEKGGVSVYGLGRFPVTLYKEQWDKLLSASEQIKTFIQDNDHLLKKKEA
jgi:hypothetical protein